MEVEEVGGAGKEFKSGGIGPWRGEDVCER